MTTLRRRALAAALFTALAAATPASAQPPGYPVAPPQNNTAMRPVPPANVAQPPAQTSINTGPATPPSVCTAPTCNPGFYPPPSYGAPAWGVANQSPAYGYLSGAANLINAQGQYLNDVASARIGDSNAKSAAIGVRNQIIQQKMYEQSLTPTVADAQQAALWNNLQAARNNPPKSQIWYGSTLNSLLAAFKVAQAQGIRGEPVPVDSQVLAHINVTTGQGGGVGAGMLSRLTRLDWPFALQDPSFKKEREQVEALSREAVEQASKGGPVPADLFRKLSDALGAMNDAVRANKEMSPTDFIEARTFLENMTSSIQILRTPNAANFFNGTFTLRGPTVADMVAQMVEQGLTFAPATPGDEPYYTTLYQAMLAYDFRLSRVASR